MSADNWDKCPRCVSRNLHTIAELAGKVSEAYGSVDVETFDQMRQELSDKQAAHDDYNAFRTFREDYEIYGAEDGLVEVSYRGGCRECGLSLEFEHAHTIDGVTS
jgi:hypothetical protein